MSNIMMVIVAEMLAAHRAKIPADEVPVEGDEGVLDALEAEAEETFAAVLAEDSAANVEAPENVVLPLVSEDQRREPQVKNLVEQAPVRADNRTVPTTPRIPFEAAELPKTPAPKDAVETDSIETSFETISPENVNPMAKGEAGPPRIQTTNGPSTDLPTAETVPPITRHVTITDATPHAAATELPEHTIETPTAETVPTQEQPILAEAPTLPRAVDPIPVEAKPRNLPPERSESAAPIAQPVQVNDAGERVDVPAEPPQDTAVTGGKQSTEVTDIEMRGMEALQIVISDPTTAADAAQNVPPPEVAKHSQTQPDVSDSDPIPAQVPQTDEPDLDTWVTASQPTAPPASKPSADFVPVSPETDPRQSTPIADDPRNGMDTQAPAAVSTDSAPNPSTLPSAPPSTAQTPTPNATAPTAVDLPQVDNSGPTTSATPPVQTERDVPPVAQQIAIAVSKSEGGTIELALRPVELGETQISMEFEAERLVVTVATERSETQDLMRRQIDDLAREFRDLGYRDVSFRFEQQTGQQGQSRQAQGETQNANHAEIEPGLPPETPAPRPTYVSGRLDIRL
ncbi:flagellar hook-length control protein FliK [Rhodovulum sp. FJ3]|uniref:flagellar hook-length control protein FliK n=1 Tax=Rhodovulum sp. FJ3 TaxID=3079053 RepID=UPI00293DBFFE|nr:flagellar hook-length control protein FliK [Rhodovulum sp. FJ3]MDV4169779.1 flagellar hook-length control protein FliK [Rhodovulum sp. FJ3]